MQPEQIVGTFPFALALVKDAAYKSSTVIAARALLDAWGKASDYDAAAGIDLATNQTLARTIMTSLTLEIALIALFFFGGPVIRSFTAAMIWGIFVATASSIFP